MTRGHTVIGRVCWSPIAPAKITCECGETFTSSDGVTATKQWLEHYRAEAQ